MLRFWRSDFRVRETKSGKQCEQFFVFSWVWHMRTLVPYLEIEPVLPIVRAQTLSTGPPVKSLHVNFKISLSVSTGEKNPAEV